VASHSGAVPNNKAREVRTWVASHQGFSIGVDRSQGKSATYFVVDIANGASAADRKALINLFSV
jgi:hypothetical protein